MQLNAVEMSQKIEQIQMDISSMMHQPLIEELAEDLHHKLTNIWEVSCELQRAVANPSIIEGYKVDAILQVFRLGELINEMDLDPDYRQVLSIGMATELVVEKIKAYKELVSFSAKTQMLTGVSAKEVA